MSPTKSDHCGDEDGENFHNNNTTSEKLFQENLLKKDYDASRSGSVRSIVAQGLVTGAVMLSSASCGMPVGYSAILLPQLKADNGSLNIDDEIGSWIASVHSAATPLGSLLSGLLMDHFGRKSALQIASLPLIVGWIVIAFCNSHYLLLLGRLIAGFSVGLTAAAGQVLIGEISEPHLRGIFSSVPFASYSFGILLVYAFGSFLNWRIVAGLSTILPIVSAVSFYFLPESPVWLVRRGYTDVAKRALMWLRGSNSTKAKQELQQLIQRVENESLQKFKTSYRTLLEPQVLKPLLIINVFNIVQVLSGTYLIVFYAVDIISHIGNENIDSFLAAVFTAGVRFLFTVFASVLLAFVGRRTLALNSGIGTAVSAGCLGTFLYFQSECNVTSNFAAICVMVYIAANTVGFMILPGVMLGELLPARVRGVAGGLTFMVFHALLFGTAKLFPLAKDSVGVHGIFWIFGGSSLVASMFLYLVLPETKGVTLGQIEDYFSEKNVLWVTRDKSKYLSRKESAFV